MDKGGPEPIDIEALLSAMAPPATPLEALALDPGLAGRLARYDPLQLAVAVAALQTHAPAQANSIRLEWMTRLALGCAEGRRRPRRSELMRLLNRDLLEARITRLEDPIEDVMVEPICTPRGEYLLLTGTWEKAGHYTETVLGAFWMLPGGEPKTEALDQVFALATLSDMVVRRSGLGRYVIGGGDPQGRLIIPPAETLEALYRRVVFTWHDLADAGIDAATLAPFVLNPARFSDLLNDVPGESGLEFQPLILAEEGVLVAAPANLSTAVRARLIDAAITGGMDGPLRRNLLAVQAGLVEQSGFVRARGPLAPFGNGFARSHVEQLSLGRYLHVLHAIDDFGMWPECAFAFATEGDPAFAAEIVGSVATARASASAQPDFQQGISVIFLAGWGSGRYVELDWPSLPNWQVLILSPHDGFVLGGCEDGTIRDLSWMNRQFDHVVQQGFGFDMVNGLLNLFQLWRATDHAFVPPGHLDVAPPINIMMPTDMLLEARREAHLAWDRRVLARPGGGFATVMRMNPRTLFDELQPVYASYTAAMVGKIVSAVLIDDTFPVWFALDQDRDDPFHADAYETFKAMLEWAVRVLPRELDAALLEGAAPVEISLHVQFPAEGLDPRRQMSDAAIRAAVSVTLDLVTRSARIVLSSDWQLALQRVDNYAEAALSAVVLNAVRTLLGGAPRRNGILAVRAILGSLDARWRHAFQVRRVVEMLKACNLLPRFEPIAASVNALVRTGIGWASHNRESGPTIDGKPECRAFLDAQTTLLLASLRTAIRRFGREGLIHALLDSIQAAQGDERQWEMSARALRAIHGHGSDYRVSLERRSQLNAVLRASSILLELALAECPEEGAAVGSMDISELQAHALLYFETADLIPAIESGRIAARLDISPTGLVLRDQSFEDATLRRSLRVTHEAQRDRAVRDYDSGAAAGSDRGADIDAGDGTGHLASIGRPALETAVRAEYGVGFDQFVGLAQSCGELALARSSGVVLVRRSELLEHLAGDGGAEPGLATVLDRLTMHPRAGWDVVPDGASSRDFDLAKFDRRFSPIGRPLLALDTNQDPRLAIAPGLVERCILHNLQGAMTGTLQGEFWSSTEMRRYVGERGRIVGTKFNESVAARLCELGLKAYPSAKPSWCFNHKNTPEVAELGDFDVLALTADGRRAWVIEAKDLKLCRTVGETARRLADYEGRMLASGKPDKMLRHLRRVAYARAHAADLARRLNLTVTPQISGLLVVRAPQPMEALAAGGDIDATVVMLADLDAVPWDAGSVDIDDAVEGRND